MKNLKFVLIFALFLIFAGCGDSNDPTPTINELSVIDGSWVFESITLKGQTLTSTNVCEGASTLLGTEYKDIPRWNLENINSKTNTGILNNTCSDGKTTDVTLKMTTVRDQYVLDVLTNIAGKQFSFDVDVTQLKNKIIKLKITYSLSLNTSAQKMVQDGAVYTLKKI